MAERTPDPVVPVLGSQQRRSHWPWKRAAAGQDRHHRHVLVSKGLLPEATAEAAAFQTANGGAETSRRPRHKEGVMTVQPDGQQPDGRKLSGGAIASLTGVGVLLVFIIQNTDRVRFQFLFWTFTWPLWWYTIMTALFGALVWFGLGVMRRHRRRVERRAAR
jgi:uncharacterized integral membrane protein